LKKRSKKTRKRTSASTRSGLWASRVPAAALAYSLQISCAAVSSYLLFNLSSASCVRNVCSRKLYPAVTCYLRKYISNLILQLHAYILSIACGSMSPLNVGVTVRHDDPNAKSLETFLCASKG
jgi:hypothetical protein